MFNDKKPSKYLICKNYEEALAKINTLHLEKNQLNVVYYKNGDKVDALLGIPGYKKDAQNIVFNSAANDNVINFSDIENQVKEIIRRNASSSTTYASEINKKLTQHTEDASVKFDEIDTSINDLSTNIYSELEATREFWNDKYDDTVNIFKHDINFTNVSTYKVSLSLSRLYRLLGISETEQSSAGESIIQQLADVKQELQELNETYNQQVPVIKRDVSTLKLDVSTLQKDNTINKIDISINKVDISTLKDLTASHTRNLSELSGNLDSLYNMLSKTIGDVNADALRQISELNGKINVINNDISVFENDFSIYQEAADASILALKDRLNNDISTKIDEIIQDVYDLSTNIYDELDRIHQNIYDVSTNVSNLDHLIDFTIYDNQENANSDDNTGDNTNNNDEENNG